MFKRILQPIVGKQSLAYQFQKNELKFRVLPPVSSVSEKKKKMVKFDLDVVSEALDFNICALFDESTR